MTATTHRLPTREEWCDPEEEGGMSDIGVLAITEAGLQLERFFAGREVYIGREQRLLHDPTDHRRFLRPDVMVVLGAPPGIREDWPVWREGRGPTWVLEVASRFTAERDREVKPLLYAALGTVELVLFDPQGLFHVPPLQLLRRGDDGALHAVAPGSNGRFSSEVLGLELAAHDYRRDLHRYWRLSFYRPGEATPLPTTAELLEELANHRAELDESRAEIERLRRTLRSFGVDEK